MGEGIRTPGRWSHNPELYQLSYAHRMSTREKPSNSGIFELHLQESQLSVDSSQFSVIRFVEPEPSIPIASLSKEEFRNGCQLITVN